MQAQAVSDEDLEKTKKELHGVHATHALRFAESAEQQHMEFGEDSPIHVLPSPGLLTSGNNALAGRLAPEHGVPSDLQPGPSQQAQVSPAAQHHSLHCFAAPHSTSSS